MSARVVVAPDSFKESLAAADVCDAVRRGVLAALPDAEVTCLPLADGGEGTAAALVAATGGRFVDVEVTGPCGERRTATFALLGDERSTAVVELASASGLELVAPDERDPRTTTTRGTGELVRAALDAGARRLVVGIGGSATNDGGAGLLQALGARLHLADGTPPGPGGAALADVVSVDLAGFDPRLADVAVEVACDVDNPLLGPTGASAVFGPQKGAGPQDVRALDAALRRWADVLAAAVGTDHRDVPGAGAAGGTGLALLAVGATLRPGVELVADVVGLDDAVRGADLVITGEGQVDAQTLHGKTPAGVLAVGRRHDVPVVVLAGSVGPGVERLHDAGATAVLPVAPGAADLAELLRSAPEHLERTARQVVALWSAGRSGAGAPRPWP